MPMHTVLILGGYGFFGTRISAALCRDSATRVLIAGRDTSKAAAAAAALGLPAQSAVRVDAGDAALSEQLASLGVDTVLHTAGPFQGQDYAVARAAINAGCNYVDLGDGRQFVAGIHTLNEAAARAGVTVVSGASSIPALSSAVVDRYAPEFAELTSVRLGISSGSRAPGIATVKGIFGYCGKPFDRLEDGVWTCAYGWLGLRRYQFPDPLGNRLFGSCDVPDLELFPRCYPTLRTVTFEAGFASNVGHLVVWAIAGLVRRGLLSSAAGCAGPLNRISRWIEPLISDKGGMFVEMRGRGRDGYPKSLVWHLVAAQNHGPNIPCGASIALVRRLARGDALPRGAMPCMGLLSLAQILEPLKELAVWEIPP